MSQGKDSLSVPGIGQESRDHPYRHSLQPKSVQEAQIFRHTKSQNYGAKKKKVKTQLPPTSEVDVTDGDSVKITVDAHNDNVKLSLSDKSEKKRHNSRLSKKHSQSSREGIDNAAFEVENGLPRSRANSAASSVRSSLRDPSVQSLSVVREQYCCCSKWSPCERTLCAAVGVLSFIILILVITVALLAARHNGKDPTEKGLFSVFKL
jgi:hypothetical protein